MAQRIKVGTVYLEVQEGAFAPLRDPINAEQTLKAEKPETPEPLEDAQYIYRPNDPFQSSIDEARAIASITSSHKPWVRKAWFLIFVVGPLIYAELFALSLVLKNFTSSLWVTFAEANAFIIPIWLMYYSIWRRKVKSDGRAN